MKTKTPPRSEGRLFLDRGTPRTDARGKMTGKVKTMNNIILTQYAEIFNHQNTQIQVKIFVQHDNKEIFGKCLTFGAY